MQEDSIQGEEDKWSSRSTVDAKNEEDQDRNSQWISQVSFLGHNVSSSDLMD